MPLESKDPRGKFSLKIVYNERSPQQLLLCEAKLMFHYILVYDNHFLGSCMTT